MGRDIATTVRMPLLMPDDFSDMHLVAWRVERGTPDPANPLLEGDTAWDGGGVGIHGSVFKDPIDSLWKAYLVCTPADFFPEEGRPWVSHGAAYRLFCLFESENGIDWSRPKLTNLPYGEHQQTNILFDPVHGMTSYGSVFVEPEDAQWPYSMIVLRENYLPSAHGTPPEGAGYYRYRSKDGRV